MPSSSQPFYEIGTIIAQFSGVVNRFFKFFSKKSKNRAKGIFPRVQEMPRGRVSGLPPTDATNRA